MCLWYLQPSPVFGFMQVMHSDAQCSPDDTAAPQSTRGSPQALQSNGRRKPAAQAAPQSTRGSVQAPLSDAPCNTDAKAGPQSTRSFLQVPQSNGRRGSNAQAAPQSTCGTCKPPIPRQKSKQMDSIPCNTVKRNAKEFAGKRNDFDLESYTAESLQARSQIFKDGEFQTLLKKLWDGLPLEDGRLGQRGYKMLYRKLYWKVVPEGTKKECDKLVILSAAICVYLHPFPYGDTFPAFPAAPVAPAVRPAARSLGNSAAYIHTFVTYRFPPPPHHFFLLFHCTFPFLGLYLSQMVHLIPYDIDL